MKKILSIFLFVCILFSCGINASAIETKSIYSSDNISYSSWSEWSTTPVYATDYRQVETRQVIKSYDLEGNCCGNSKGERCYLKYMQDGYTLRLHYDRITRNKTEVDNWAKWEQGSFYTYASNVNGYIIGPGTAYIEPNNCIPYFIVATNYETQYRYRDKYISIDNCTVSLSQLFFNYDGNSKYPLVTVIYNNMTLVQGVDYTLTYYNNKNIGTATVSITGKGYYYGTINKYFSITKLNDDSNSNSESKDDNDSKSGNTKSNENSGSSSSSSTKKNQMKLKSPKINRITTTLKGVKISWNKVSGASLYCVLKRSGKSSWKKIITVSKNIYIDKKCKSGIKYYYTVVCVSKNGKYISSYNKSGKNIKYIAPPKITKIYYSSKGHVIKWKKVKGVYKYRLYLKKGKKLKKLIDTSKNKFVYKKTKIGIKYTYVIRCLNKKGKIYKTAFDKKGKSFKCIKAPRKIILKRNSYGIDLKWNNIKKAKYYKIYYRYKKSYGKSKWSSWRFYRLDPAYSQKENYCFVMPDVEGKLLQFRVCCATKNNENQSAYCYSKSIRFCTAPVVTYSSFLICPRASDYIKFSWNYSTGAYKYIIYTKNGNKWKKYTDSFSSSYTYYCEPRFTHYFAIRAVDSKGHKLSTLECVKFTYSYGKHYRNTWTEK